MEAILTVALCGIMGTALVVSIQRIAKLSYEAKRESALSRIIHNELFFATTNPRLQEGQKSRHVEEWDVDLETIVTPLQDLLDQEGQPLTKLYKIEVKAVWWEDGEYVNHSAETWRHSDLYAR